jgi:hypothetical protein
MAKKAKVLGKRSFGGPVVEGVVLVNQAKVERAIAALPAKYSEKQLLDEYVKIGGLVKDKEGVTLSAESFNKVAKKKK